MKNIISFILTTVISISTCCAMEGSIVEPERMTRPTPVPVEFFTMRPIETERLVIRRFEDKDFDIENPNVVQFLTTLLTRDLSDPMDKDEGYPAPETIPELIKNPSCIQEMKDILQSSTTHLRLGVFDRGTEKCFGRANLFPPRYFNNSLEITQNYFPNARGKGYGTEAKFGILQFLKDNVAAHPEWNILYLEAAINSDNPASLKLAEKTGSIRYRPHEERADDKRQLFYTPLT